MIIYFALSGAWQIFRLNDLPKEGEPTAIQKFLHDVSNPHIHSTMPGLSSKTDHSAAFDWIALVMSVGLIATTILGLALAIRYSKSKKVLALAIFAGVALPILMLCVR